MIRHIVLARFRPDVGSNEIAGVFNQLAALRGPVAGIQGFHAGASVSPEGLERGYSHAFTVDFADANARDAYLVHPAHKEAGARLVAACAGGLDGILVMDIDISR